MADNATIPASGSKCPARIWPFRRHEFTTRQSWFQDQWFNTDCCKYCGGKFQ